jgi:hypothetical protein
MVRDTVKYRMRAFFLLTFALTGCMAQESYELRVRDPAAASIQIDTAHGPEVLVAPGKAPEERTLPRTSPPYGSTALFEASAIRDELGGITLRCDACLEVPIVHAIPAGPGVVTLQQHTLPGDLPQLAWTPDALHVHLGYPYFSHPGKYLHGPFEAFRYDVVIPREALEEVRKKRENLHPAGWTMLVIGALLSVGSVALLYDGGQGIPPRSSTSHTSAGTVLEIMGGSLLALPALVLDISGIAYIATPGGYDERIGP